MNENLVISLSTDEYDILSSGSVIIPGKQKLYFQISNLKLIIKRDIEYVDGKVTAPHYGLNLIDDTTLELTLYNIENNSLFSSPHQMIHLTENLDVSFCFSSLSNNSKDLLFVYTFYKKR